MNAELSLDDAEESKLAVFQRSIGILLDDKKLERLPAIDQLGLLYHESLRMISLGFRIALSTGEIEQITCSAFTNKRINVPQFASLKAYIDALVAQKPTLEEKKEMLQVWERTFASMADTDNLNLQPFVTPQVFFQAYASRFEFLRVTNPRLSMTELEEAFFGWAAKEVPGNCSGLEACDYYEKWPSEISGQSSSQTWLLARNNEAQTVWKQDQSDLMIGFSKREMPPPQVANFCKALSQDLKFNLLEPSRQDLEALQTHSELNILLTRSNLNSIWPENDNDTTPFLLKDSGRNYYWEPDSEQAYRITGEGDSLPVRAFCIGYKNR